MPRLNEICKICLPAISREEQDMVWYGLCENGREGAVEAAASFGLEITEKEVRRHFEYHFPRQPEPRETWSKDQAFRNANALTKRKQNIIELAFRLGAVDADIVAKGLYWDGTEEKWRSAEKAALRDLRQLMNNDYLFRIFSENLPGKNIWMDSLPAPAFFLGANGRSWAEKATGMEVGPKDLTKTVEDAGDWTRILGILTPNRLLESFWTQLPDHEPPMARSGGINGIHAMVDAKNFFNYRFLNIKLTDPLRSGPRLRTSGIGAFTLFDKNFKSFLTPFIYHYDDGRRKIDNLLSDILSQQSLTRSGQIKEISTQMHPAQIVPAIVIAGDPERQERIQKEANRVRGKIIPDFPVFITSQESLGISLTEPVWNPLFYNRGERKYLIPEMIQAYKRHPLEESRLQLIGSKRKL